MLQYVSKEVLKSKVEEIIPQKHEIFLKTPQKSRLPAFLRKIFLDFELLGCYNCFRYLRKTIFSKRSKNTKTGILPMIFGDVR